MFTPNPVELNEIDALRRRHRILIQEKARQERSIARGQTIGKLKKQVKALQEYVNDLIEINHLQGQINHQSVLFAQEMHKRVFELEKIVLPKRTWKGRCRLVTRLKDWWWHK